MRRRLDVPGPTHDLETKMNDREYRSSRKALSRARDRGVALVLSFVLAAAIEASDHDHRAATHRSPRELILARRTKRGRSYEGIRPYDLRHSFRSLLIYEGANIIEVADEMGHGASMTLRTYGHVFKELKGVERVPAEALIRAARDELVPVQYPAGIEATA
jgi:integrase